MKVNQKIGSCGLACILCSAKMKGECFGCSNDKAETCKIKACCVEKNIEGCYECENFPCESSMFNNLRLKTFVKCARDKGVSTLISCLERNSKANIIYHTTDGSKGDYDVLTSEDDIMDLILNGR